MSVVDLGGDEAAAGRRLFEALHGRPPEYEGGGLALWYEAQGERAQRTEDAEVDARIAVEAAEEALEKLRAARETERRGMHDAVM